MNNTEQKLRIINNVVSQAIFYLNNADEFFPFGAVGNIQNDINPLSVYFDEENPASVNVIEKLHEAILKGIKNGNYKCGAIGIDVLLNKKSALQVRFYNSNGDIETSYYEYYKSGLQYVINKM